jgi:hypothetical protein
MSVTGTLGSIITGENQLAGILQGALTLFAVFKSARDKWVADHPNTPVPAELTDAYWIAKLGEDSDKLIAHAQAIANKWGAPDPSTSPGA